MAYKTKPLKVYKRDKNAHCLEVLMFQATFECQNWESKASIHASITFVIGSAYVTCLYSQDWNRCDAWKLVTQRLGTVTGGVVGRGSYFHHLADKLHTSLY